MVTAVELITAAEARGDSRMVSTEEFLRLAERGRAQLQAVRAGGVTPTGLDDNWEQIKASAYREAQRSWGGVTIDAHTGQALQASEEKYAVTVKEPGQKTVTVPEGASQDEFSAAMDEARCRFDRQLCSDGGCLGVFHDDDKGRIDIDPVRVVDTLDEVESIGAATHAVGGAYNFATGNGHFPPHVEPSIADPRTAGQATGPLKGSTEADVRMVSDATPEDQQSRPDY